MNKISLVYPIFRPTDKLIKDHIDRWRNFSMETRKHLHIIISDDYSETIPNFDAINFPINFTLCRVAEDKTFNVCGAKNLGMTLVKTDWALQTDIDHFVSEELLLDLMTMKLVPHSVYRFQRVKEHIDGHLETRHPHENSFFMETYKFWGIGGYDEDMGGVENGRGFEDALIHQQMIKYGLKDVYLQDKLYEKAEYITPGLNRDHSRNAILFRQKLADPNYKPGPVLRFKWEILRELRYD